MTLLGAVDNLLIPSSPNNGVKANGISHTNGTTNGKDLKGASSSSLKNHTAKNGNSVATSPRSPTVTTTTTKKSDADDNEDEDKLRYSPLIKEDKDQAMVQTPFGKGLVVRTRKHPRTGRIISRDIELTDWKTAAPKRGPPKPAMMYTAVEYPSVAVEVGSDVVVKSFGGQRGRVVEIRQNNNNSNTEKEEDIVVVQLSSWRLAGRSRVVCHAKISHVQVVRPKLIYEMNVFERVEHAQYLKDQARQVFLQKNYESALSKYALAVDAVRYVQHQATSTNEVRADLLVVMITCCNNAATCATSQATAAAAATPSTTKLQNQWDLVTKYAKNALVLIEALEERQTGGKKSKVFDVLKKEGFDSIKIFGEWKTKSLLFLARANAEKQNYGAAMEDCKKAHETIAKYLVVVDDKNDNKSSNSNKVLLQNAQEVKRIHAACKERKKLVLKKEKQRAQAMFGGSSNGGNSSSSASPKSEKIKKANDNNGNHDDDDVMRQSKQENSDGRDLMDDTSRKSVRFEDGGTPRDFYVKPDKNMDGNNASDNNNNDDMGAPGGGGGGGEEDLPWYEEHQELLILATGLAVVGVGLTQYFWRRK